MKYLKETDSRKLTKTYVKSFRKMPRFPKDRGIKSQNAFELKRAIDRHIPKQNEELTPFTWMTIYVKDHNMTYRGDGNHSSMLLDEVLDFSKLGDLELYLQHWHADTMDEAFEIWINFNRSTSSKSASDHTSVAQAVGDHRQQGIPKKHYDKIITGICLARTGFVTKPRDQTSLERARYLESPDHKEFVSWFSPFISKVTTGSLTSDNLLRSPIIAAAFIHWKTNKEKCKKFWTSVKNGNTSTNTPTRKLHEILSRAILLGAGNQDIPVKDIKGSRGFLTIPLKKESLMNNRLLVNVCNDAFSSFLSQRNPALKFNPAPFEVLK